MKRSRRRGILTVALPIAIAAAGWWWWNTRAPAPPGASSGVPSVLIAPLLTVGRDVEPWSGAGLSDQIRIALASDSSTTVLRAEHPVPAAEDENAEAVAQARIARRAGARYVVIGTLGRQHGKTEINLRLIRASDATMAWSGTFWRSGTDLTSVAGDLAREISEAMQIQGRRSDTGLAHSRAVH